MRLPRKHINWALLLTGLVSCLGLVVIVSYLKKVNADAALPASYEEAVIQRIRASQQDPLVTYIPEGLRGTDELPEVNTTDPVYGNVDASVTIIAFSDLECPGCSTLDVILRAKVDESNETVRLVWKDFPIPRIHKQSEEAAEAARCAQNQGKFWEFTQDLFANQLLLGEDVYTAAAEEENLDIAEFTACRSSDEMKALIQRDYLTGRSFQIDQTPTIYVGGHRLQGVIEEAEIDQALDQAFGRQ